MEVVQILVALNALMNLAVDAQINLGKLQQLREASGGKLTNEDLMTLSMDAQSAIDSIQD